MTNNQLCGILGFGGIFVCFLSMIAMFFGSSVALYPCLFGLLMALVGMLEYEE